MIKIVQGIAKSTDKAEKSLRDSEAHPIKIPISSNMINKDINCLQSEKADTNNKYNAKNIEALQNNLHRLLKKSNSENCSNLYEMSWDNKGIQVYNADRKPGRKSEIIAYPVNFIYEPLYKINMNHYIEVQKYQKLVTIDLSEIAQMVAFEYIYKEYDFSTKDIDNMLVDCSYTVPEDSSILLNAIKQALDGDDAYQLGRETKVSNSIHLDTKNNRLYDYFGLSYIEFKPKKTGYKEIITYSCQQIALIIYNELLSSLQAIGGVAQCVMLSPRMLSLIVEKPSDIREAVNDDEIRTKVLDNICIRMFGRMFKINTHSKLY